jgi:hypothetical protein
MAEPQVKGPASCFPSIEMKYGRRIAEWKELLRGAGPTTHEELVTWLKTEHGSPGPARTS